MFQGRVHAPGDLLGVSVVAPDVRLTDEQEAAVERRHGATLLDAGAGSGKTSVLVERFARAVERDGVDPARILAITFTEKAAAELRERIRVRLRPVGDGASARATDDGWISTIHGFCARVLRAHALDAGLDPWFSVLDADGARALADRAFDAAVAAVAETEGGSELIAAHRLPELRAAVVGAYAELRARGQRTPVLPTPVLATPPVMQTTVLPTPVMRAAGDAEGGAAAVTRLAAVRALAAEAALELGAVPNPGVSIERALGVLERAMELGDEIPWPGELTALTLKNGATALKSETCTRYREALAELIDAAAAGFAIVQRDALDQLLRGYGERYAAFKRERGVVDFDDLEILARDLLRIEAIRRSYSERFDHVMVDELQDTNAVQLELVDLVAGDAALFMVGDAQQSIYAFRHADVELFEARGRVVAQTGGRLSLQTNFRTRAQILEVLNAGFAAVLGERFRPLRPGRVDPPAAEPLVELLCVDKGVEWTDDTALAAPWRVAEARVLAARVAELVAGGTCSAGDVVVLTRATTDLRVYERALEDAGVPTFVVGGRGYWQHPQVLQLVAYLRALANPLDEESLYTVLVSPLCGLSLDGLVMYAAGARESLGVGDAAALAAFEAWFEDQRRAAARLGPEELLSGAIAQRGYDLSVLAQAGGRRRLANVRKLLRLAREFEREHGPDLHGFIGLLAVRIAGGGGAREGEAPVESESVDAVRLMTIHRSKGLEFPVVCVADLGRAPSFRAPLLRLGRDGARIGIRIGQPGTSARFQALDYNALKAEADLAELDEQRRLFYVAMTRARERLVLSGAARIEKLGQLQTTPMDWIAPAFMDLPGVRTRFVSELEDHGESERRDIAEERIQHPMIEAPEPLDLSGGGAVETLSYSGLAAYRACGYRFYVERILGLPPTPVESTGSRERGIELHEQLYAFDFTDPAPTMDPARRTEAVPASEDNASIAAFSSCATATRLRQAADVRKEQSFAFPLRDLLITGVFDVLATEPSGNVLVVDYKSDPLRRRDPERIVAGHYAIQRLIYALAALRTGAHSVEVVHLFLEDPESPASRVYAQADLRELEHQLDHLTYGLRAGEFPVSDEPWRGLCAGCPAAGTLCSWPEAMTARAATDSLF